MPTLIVPAAGFGTRFSGIEVPKALLRFTWNGRTDTMLGHQLYEARNAFPDLEVHVGPQQRYAGVFLEELPDVRVHPVPEWVYRQGQATTVSHLVNAVDCDGPFLVSNCDVWMGAESWAWLAKDWPSLAVFDDGRDDGDPTPYSHVTERGEFAEKRRISRHAIAGFYAMPSAEAVLRAYRLTEWENGENYLSAMLANITREWSLVAAHGFTDFGTPEALRRAGAVLSF